MHFYHSATRAVIENTSKLNNAIFTVCEIGLVPGGPVKHFKWNSMCIKIGVFVELFFLFSADGFAYLLIADIYFPTWSNLFSNWHNQRI